MNSEQWARRVERWDAWARETRADLEAKAATGDEQAKQVLARAATLQRAQKIPSRTALNRALRGR